MDLPRKACSLLLGLATSLASCWDNYLQFATEPHVNSLISLQCIFLKCRGTLKEEL